MHQFVPKVSMATATTVAVAVLASTGSAVGRTSAATSKKVFSGNVCAAASGANVAAVDISDPCVRLKTIKQVTRTGAGVYRTESFRAQWGTLGNGEAAHDLNITVSRPQGSRTAVGIVAKRFKLAVLANGEPIHVGSLGSVGFETISCVNPPTNDCTDGSLLALVGPYQLLIQLVDHPPTVAGAPEPPGVDDGEDKAQEDTLKAPLIAIAQAVAAKL